MDLKSKMHVFSFLSAIGLMIAVLSGKILFKIVGLIFMIIFDGFLMLFYQKMSQKGFLLVPVWFYIIPQKLKYKIYEFMKR